MNHRESYPEELEDVKAVRKEFARYPKDLQYARLAYWAMLERRIGEVPDHIYDRECGIHGTLLSIPNDLEIEEEKEYKNDDRMLLEGVRIVKPFVNDAISAMSEVAKEMVEEPRPMCEGCDYCKKILTKLSPATPR